MSDTTRSPKAPTAAAPIRPGIDFDFPKLLRGIAQPWPDMPATRTVYAALGHALLMAQQLELALSILLSAMHPGRGEDPEAVARELVDRVDRRTLGQLTKEIGKWTGGAEVAAQLAPMLKTRNDLIHNFLRTEDRFEKLRTAEGCAELVAEVQDAGRQFQELAGTILALDLVVYAFKGFRRASKAAHRTGD